MIAQNSTTLKKKKKILQNEGEKKRLFRKVTLTNNNAVFSRKTNIKFKISYIIQI